MQGCAEVEGVGVTLRPKTVGNSIACRKKLALRSSLVGN